MTNTNTNDKAEFIAGWAAWVAQEDLDLDAPEAFKAGYCAACRADVRESTVEAAWAERVAEQTFRAASHARFAAGLCVTTHDGKTFACNNRVPPQTLALGCGVCAACEQREADYEGYCDGEAQRRMEGPQD